MKILITGGAGYIGYELVNALEREQSVDEIVVLDNLFNGSINFFTTGEPLKKTRFIKGDILNPYDLEKVIKNQDVVIHLAGHVDFPYTYKDNYKYEQVNQFGTAVLYSLLEKSAPEKLVYLSSAAVYGFRDVLGESTSAEPMNYYGKSKLEAEKYVELLKEKSEVIIFRSANVFGYNPLVRLDSVINKFIFDALLYRKIHIHGNGNQTRPFISLQILVENIVDSVIGSPYGKGVFNLTEGNMSLNEIRDYLKDRIPDLEFTYVNPNHEILGMKMWSERLPQLGNMEQSLNIALESFGNIMRIQK